MWKCAADVVNECFRHLELLQRMQQRDRHESEEVPVRFRTHKQGSENEMEHSWHRHATKIGLSTFQIEVIAWAHSVLSSKMHTPSTSEWHSKKLVVNFPVDTVPTGDVQTVRSEATSREKHRNDQVVAAQRCVLSPDEENHSPVGFTTHDFVVKSNRR